MSDIKIYVACLASYNAGDLHGRWVDATQGEDGILDEIDDILRTSKHPNVMVDCPDCEVGRRGMGVIQGSSADVHYPCDRCDGKGKIPSAEEWAIHDYEGFGSLADMLGEHPSIGNVAALAELIEEHGEAFMAFVTDIEGSLSDHDAYEWRKMFTEKYQGEYKSKEEFAAEYIEQTCDLKDVPDIIKNNIDYAAIAREFEQGGDFTFVEKSWREVYVFNNC